LKAVVKAHASQVQWVTKQVHDVRAAVQSHAAESAAVLLDTRAAVQSHVAEVAAVQSETRAAFHSHAAEVWKGSTTVI